MSEARTYSPAAVCALFGIAKSTLFRWETEGAIPPVGRDLKNHRAYTVEHLASIGQRQIESQFASAAKTGNGAMLAALTERLALQKFLEADQLGLLELKELSTLSFDTQRVLLQEAIERCNSFDDPVFRMIIQIAYKHTTGGLS